MPAGVFDGGLVHLHVTLRFRCLLQCVLASLQSGGVVFRLRLKILDEGVVAGSGERRIFLRGLEGGVFREVALGAGETRGGVRDLRSLCGLDVIQINSGQAGNSRGGGWRRGFRCST